MKLLLASLLLLFSITPLPAAVQVREFKTARGGRVWIYKPDAKADAKLPCVLVAAAGSNFITGVSLGKEDRAEHQPYADAGFVVAAYDVSGATAEGESDEAKLVEAIKAYSKSDFGMEDAMAALVVAKEKVPQIDPRRIYAAGHSSAGTLALQLAASHGEIRGVAAYAPVVDLEGHIGTETIDRINASVMFYKRIGRWSPKNYPDLFRVPMFLFHAKDDEKPWVEAIESFHQSLENAKVPHEYVTAESGGHYDSMIKTGLPKGVAWLKKLDAGIAAAPKAAAGSKPLAVSPDLKIEFQDDGIHLGDFTFLAGKTTRSELIATLGEPDRSLLDLAFQTGLLYYDAAGLVFQYKIGELKGSLPRPESPLDLNIYLKASEGSGPAKVFPGKVLIRGVEIRAGITRSKVAADLGPKFTKEEAAIGDTFTSIRRFAKSYTNFYGGKLGSTEDAPVDSIACARPMP